MTALALTQIGGASRLCAFMRAVRMDGNECSSIARAVWWMGRSSAAGAVGSGAMATIAGAENGKVKSATVTVTGGNDVVREAVPRSSEPWAGTCWIGSAKQSA